MATKPIPADVAAERAQAMAQYQTERLAAVDRMAQQRAARLARDAKLTKKKKVANA